MEIFAFALFAASLHLLMAVGGMVSFGHAAYFGLGAYGAALLLKLAGLPMPAAFVAAPLVAALAAAVFGYFCVRLTSIYFAMLTLAFAQIVYAIVHQWDDVTGGDNGVLSVWPASWLATPGRYYYWALVATVAGIVLLRRVAASPFGLTLRAARDHARRAEALGVNIRALQWTAFVVAGFVAGIGGRGLRVPQGQRVPGLHRVADVGATAGDGAPGRHRVALRSAHRRGGLQAARHRDHALHRLLAARAGRDPGGAGARVPAGHRGRARRPATVSEPGTGPVLETRGLSKSFGGVRAVSSVDLAMPKGEIRALIGPNGAGKTTFFNMLTGQLRADAGSVLFKGQRLSGLPPYAVWRRGVSRTFQITATFATLSALDNVRVARLSHAGKTYSLLEAAARLQADEARALLDQVGLVEQADRVAAVLAYGDLKKLELAVALANDPEVLLLDEPTAGMAPAERGALMALTERIARARGLTVLFTEHDMDVVFAVADRIMVLHQGRVIAEGRPAEVRADAQVQRVYLGEEA